MMKFFCKECWVAQDPATVLARCKECDARTIARPDVLRVKAGNGADLSGYDSEIVCRLHQKEPLDLFCGECRREIPPRALLAERSIVALVGDTASGKTWLLWVVTERLRHATAAGISIRQPIGDSDLQLARVIRNGGARPTPETDADVRNYAWEVASPNGGSVIAFHDAAGEVWRGLGKLSRIEYERFYRYLGLVGSFVFAIDGERVVEGLDVAARRKDESLPLRVAITNEITIATELARKIRVRDEPTPIAVTITKSDMLWERSEGSIFREGSGSSAEEIDVAVRDLLEKSGRHALLETLAAAFSPIQFFAVSAFGRHSGDAPNCENLQPSRVEEPLLALLGAGRAQV